MKIVLALLSAATALTLALPVAAQDGGPQDKVPCFWGRDVRNHTVGDAHTMYFDVNGRDTYKVTMSNACLAGAVSSDTIVVKRASGSGNICRAMDLDIGVLAGGPSRCIVSGLAKMTPAEVDALPKKLRP